MQTAFLSERTKLDQYGEREPTTASLSSNSMIHNFMVVINWSIQTDPSTYVCCSECASEWVVLVMCQYNNTMRTDKEDRSILSNYLLTDNNNDFIHSFYIGFPLVDKEFSVGR